MKFKEPSDFVLNTIKSDLRVFNIIKRRSGKSPAIITIDGFLSQDVDKIEEWELGINERFPDHAWYHLNWQSETPKGLFRRSSQGLLGASGIVATQFMSLGIPLVTFALLGASKTWRNAVKNSEEAGRLLSRVLKNSDYDEFILVGHSLGSKVILHCLQGLKFHKTIIKDIHLLGGAVSNNKKNWRAVESSINGKIYNYYSTKDTILLVANKLTLLENTPIGRSEIVTKKTSNMNVTKIVRSHMDFKLIFEYYINRE